MTNGWSKNGFAIALLGQVVLCLAAAPILAAEQWAAAAVSSAHDKSPRDARVTLQAAFDASNAKPEGFCRVRIADRHFCKRSNGPWCGPYIDDASRFRIASFAAPFLRVLICAPLNDRPTLQTTGPPAY